MNNRKVKVDDLGYVLVTFDGSIEGLVPSGSNVMNAPEEEAAPGFVWRYVDGEFVQEPDLRGTTYESQDGLESITVRSYGQVIPDGWQVQDEDRTRLRQVKQQAWLAIKSKRDALERSGFPYMDKVFDSDSLSVQRITGAVQAAQAAMALGQPFSIAWTTADNSVVALDGPQMVGVPVALALYVNQLFEIARPLRDAIGAATTIEAVDAVVWPGSLRATSIGHRDYCLA